MKFIEELPPSRNGERRTHWADVFDQLLANPGKWAELTTRKGSRGGFTGAYKVRREQYPDIQLVQRKGIDGTVTLYGRAVTK